ncbi:MAG: ribose 5-phosphate isomerase B [Chloroflexi bacterium]|nr:ribose 5-phosphate isomerase B [Chloroflexota bacterium]
MRIAIGSDHAGYQLKELVGQWLTDLGHEVRDFGTQGSESTDYPRYGRLVAEAVAEGEAERGVLVCGTGIGMSITANKVPGVRAAVCHDAFTTRLCRAHNDANVLCLGARVLGEGVVQDLLPLFLDTPFEGGRHTRRLGLICALEEDAPRRAG